jgi:hypothetical protein
VVSDPANPRNEGKVFLFKYGKKIFDKLNEAMNPQFADEKALNPFDMWDGANFKIKIRNVDGYRNYDKSEFGIREPLNNDDDTLEQIWKTEYSLKDFLDPKNFKDYDTLKQKLNAVLGLAVKSHTGDAEDMPSAPARVQHESAAPVAPSKPAKIEESAPWAEDEDEEDLAYFKKLASE